MKISVEQDSKTEKIAVKRCDCQTCLIDGIQTAMTEMAKNTKTRCDKMAEEYRMSLRVQRETLETIAHVYGHELEELQRNQGWLYIAFAAEFLMLGLVLILKATGAF